MNWETEEKRIEKGRRRGQRREVSEGKQRGYSGAGQWWWRVRTDQRGTPWVTRAEDLQEGGEHERVMSWSITLNHTS